jgi:hypothetical protein
MNCLNLLQGLLKLMSLDLSHALLKKAVTFAMSMFMAYKSSIIYLLFGINKTKK